MAILSLRPYKEWLPAIFGLSLLKLGIEMNNVIDINTKSKAKAKVRTDLLELARDYESYFAIFARMAGYKSVDAVFSGIGEGLLKKGNIEVEQEELFRKLTGRNIFFFHRFMKKGIFKKVIMDDKINKLWKEEWNPIKGSLGLAE